RPSPELNEPRCAPEPSQCTSSALGSSDDREGAMHSCGETNGSRGVASMDELHHQFDERGRRWAWNMLNRLHGQGLEVPLIWPGTAEQARTIVHAFADERLAEKERARLMEIVQSGARAAWQELLAA